MGTRATHWTVRLNARNRSVFFAVLFVVLAFYLAERGAAPLEWILLGVNLLIYPWVALFRARAARHQVRAELQNLLFDGFLFGIWVAYWGFPLWITFSVFTAVTLNQVVFESLRGLWHSLLALAAGAAIGLAIAGAHFRPDTSLPVSMLCIVGLTAYLWNFAYAAFTRGVALQDSRRQLEAQLTEITTLQEQLQDQASRDPLTGLYNRRHLEDRLADELNSCRRDGLPLTLVMVDIDQFKLVNDTYGHPTGDAILRELAGLLARRSGPRDVVFRYGGEEFLMMLPGVSLADAQARAEELRVECEATRVAVDDATITTTLSFGIANYPEHDLRSDALVELADRALYAAKVNGRNRIEFAEPGPTRG
ncbi:sensor domain-containing diguanylate cyclase [Nakamurella lactea]|uniref:sensor domain-containing diguanylate cyclase n=1 Tax=Nakamurella lactea TaxID=459515 RepID=UPI00056BBF06|nr:sensor domain-containing diguanylate cyclase [Nakamurella lactea]